MNNQNLIETVRKIQENLREDERVLVRASGTESKVRIMVEGESESENNARLLLLENAVLSTDGKSKNE